MKGKVTHVAALPNNNNVANDVKEFQALAGRIFKRKTSLDYQDFNQFSKDSELVIYVEFVKLEDRICFVCSCELSMKGHDCIHEYCILLKEKYLVRPSEVPLVGRYIRKKGNLCKNRKQRRF